MEAHLKKLIFVCFVFSLLAPLSRAQDTPKVEVSLEYSTMFVAKGFTFWMHGGDASVAVNANRWLGFVGDFAAHHAHPGVDLTSETYMFGPRISIRKWGRLTPFAQVLVGGQHSSTVTTGFTNATDAFAFGGGVGGDIDLDRSGRFALRGHTEYLGFRAKSDTTTISRWSAGIVYRFGRK